MRIRKTSTKDSVLRSISEGLSDKPELAARIETIIKMVGEPGEGGRIRSADEVEALLVEELRKLVNESLVGWAEGVDRRVGEDLRKAEPGAKMREKKL